MSYVYIFYANMIDIHILIYFNTSIYYCSQPSISSSDSLSTVESADTTSSPSSVTSYEGDVYYDDYLNTSARRGRRRSSTSTQRLIEEQQQKIAKHQRLLEKSLAKMPAPLLPTQRRPLSTGVRKRSTTPVNAYKNKTGTKNEYSHRYAYNRPNPNVSKNTSGRTVEYVPNRTSSSHRGRVYSMNSTNMNKSRRSAPSLRFGESPTIQSRKGWNDSTKSFHSPKAKPVKTKVHPLVQPAWVDQVASPLKEKINDAVRTSYNQLVDTTKHLNAMCDKDAQECAQQMTGLQKWTDKLEAARKRKEDIAQVANMKSIEYNRRHDENACRIKEKRWAADLLRESESFEQKLKSQDYVLLKQV